MPTENRLFQTSDPSFIHHSTQAFSHEITISSPSEPTASPCSSLDGPSYSHHHHQSYPDLRVLSVPYKRKFPFSFDLTSLPKGHNEHLQSQEWAQTGLDQLANRHVERTHENLEPSAKSEIREIKGIKGVDKTKRKEQNRSVAYSMYCKKIREMSFYLTLV